VFILAAVLFVEESIIAGLVRFWVFPRLPHDEEIYVCDCDGDGDWIAR
jgi:hypothetical protein